MAPGLQIASILYHDVVDNPSESGFQRNSALAYKHSLSEFGQNLDRIAKSPVAPGLVTDIYFARPARYLLLTFDDGGKSAVYISDELGKRGWKAHFFITTSLIGTRTFLDKDEIKYLHSCGHIIGSHSHTHPDIFKGIPSEKMNEEWRISCDILSQLLGKACIAASVPGGDTSLTVLRSAGTQGIGYLFTSDPTLVPQKEGNCWILGRICVKTGDPLSRVEAFARFQGWAREQWAWRLKAFVKSSLFPLYRLYVRRATHEW